MVARGEERGGGRGEVRHFYRERAGREVALLARLAAQRDDAGDEEITRPSLFVITLSYLYDSCLRRCSWWWFRCLCGALVSVRQFSRFSAETRLTTFSFVREVQGRFLWFVWQLG